MFVVYPLVSLYHLNVSSYGFCHGCALEGHMQAVRPMSHAMYSVGHGMEPLRNYGYFDLQTGLSSWLV